MIEATNHEAARACVVPWTMAFVKQELFNRDLTLQYAM